MLLENPGTDSGHAKIREYADALRRVGATDPQVEQLRRVVAEISFPYDRMVQSGREASDPPSYLLERLEMAQAEWDDQIEYWLNDARENASDQLIVCTLALEKRLFPEHTPEYRERQDGIDAILNQRKAEAEMDRDGAWHEELEGSRNNQAMYEFLSWAKLKFLERLQDIITRFDAPPS